MSKFSMATAAALVAVAGTTASAAKNPNPATLQSHDGSIAINDVSSAVTGTRANILVVDLSGIEVFGGSGTGSGINNPLNLVLNNVLSPNAQVIGIGWDLNFQAFSPSWRSEVTIAFEDSARSDGIFLTPSNEGSPGFHASSSPIVDLVGLGLDFPVLGDGILRIQAFDTFNDFGPNVRDAVFGQGSTVTVEWVPAPGAFALLGLGGLAATRRRR